MLNLVFHPMHNSFGIYLPSIKSTRIALHTSSQVHVWYDVIYGSPHPFCDLLLALAISCGVAVFLLSFFCVNLVQFL